MFYVFCLIIKTLFTMSTGRSKLYSVKNIFLVFVYKSKYPILI